VASVVQELTFTIVDVKFERSERDAEINIFESALVQRTDDGLAGENMTS
jgi:hypothetical protein